MIELKFVLATQDMLDSIVEMFTDAINKMKEINIYQWDEIYPNRNLLEEDIKKKQLYIALYNGEVVSAYVLNKECDEEYINGEWKYPNSTYYVIHRLCVNPKYQNNGIGQATMKYIENNLRQMNIETIRLDAFSLNPYALKMYERLGFSKVGIAKWRMGKFYLMEKKI
ncbi:MAG: GNAT family N-acetyltransferase [Clostridium sp.]